ncbi:haloacid dehalogenase-like hydrolase [Patescibacteria group bacterium]|nr:haloacid dehalogenase-like hydrolase [Patescibacteria group bacterium]
MSSLPDALAKSAERIDNGHTQPFLLSCIPPEELIQRLAEVRHGIFDFDDTLATGNQHEELRKFMPEETSAFDLEYLYWILGADKTFRGVRPQEFWWFDPDNHKSIQTAVIEAFFVGMNVGTMRAEHIDQQIVEQVSAAMVAREGVPELFARLQHTCIITYGYEDVVKMWAERSRIKTHVSGIRLAYDQNEKVAGAYPGSLIVGQTKGFAAEEFRTKFGINHHGILTIGDRPFDIEMFYDDPSAVNALIFSPNKAKERFDSFDIPANRERWNRVTCVLVSDSLQPLVDMLPNSPADDWPENEVTTPDRPPTS